MPTLQQLSNFISHGLDPDSGLVTGIFIAKNRPHMKLLVIERKHTLHTRIETYLKNLSGSSAATFEYTRDFEQGAPLEITLVFFGIVSLSSKFGDSKSAVGKNYCSILRHRISNLQGTHLPWLAHFSSAGMSCQASLELVVQIGEITKMTPKGLLNGNCESSHDVHDVLARITDQNINFFDGSRSHGSQKLKPQTVTSNLESQIEESEFLDFGTSDTFDSYSHEIRHPTLDIVSDYLVRINQYRVLKAEEEVALHKAVEVGLLAHERLYLDRTLAKEDQRLLKMLIRSGEKAKVEIINCNLKLVVSIAKSFQNRGLHYIDVIQEGNLGLIKAVEKFDYQLGYKFSTYATWWIRQGIERGIADKGRMIRLPVHVIQTLSKVYEARRVHFEEYGDYPTLTELAEYVDELPIKLENLFEMATPPFSLETPLDDQGKFLLQDLILDDDGAGPEDIVLRQGKSQAVEFILNLLSDRERAVIRSRYGLDDGEMKTLDQIGEMHGVTRERIRQIELMAMSRLRYPTYAYYVMDYLTSD